MLRFVVSRRAAPCCEVKWCDVLPLGCVVFRNAALSRRVGFCIAAPSSEVSLRLAVMFRPVRSGRSVGSCKVPSGIAAMSGGGLVLLSVAVASGNVASASRFVNV